MKKFSYHRKLFVLLPFFSLLLLCCSNAGDIPEIVNMDVSIQNREMTPKDISVKEDDTLTLNIISDESGTIHIHGYRIEQRVEKNEETRLRFDTGATGQFNIAFHIGEAGLSNGEHPHQHNEVCTTKLSEGSPTPEIKVVIKTSEVEANHIDVVVDSKGMEFSPTGNHWHLLIGDKLIGMYSQPEITLDASDIGTVEQLATNKETTITVNDSNHCLYEDIHPQVTYMHEKMTDMHQEHNSDSKGAEETEEVILGSLKVYPR